MLVPDWKEVAKTNDGQNKKAAFPKENGLKVGCGARI